MIVAGLPLIRIALPTMSAAPPKSRCQSPWPMSATFSAPGVLSAGVKSRPFAGLTPSTRKNVSVT